MIKKMAAKWLRSGAKTSLSSSLSSRLASELTIQAIENTKLNRGSAWHRAKRRISAVIFSSVVLDKRYNRHSLSKPHRDYITTELKQLQAILDSVNPKSLRLTRFPIQIWAGPGSSVLLHSGKVLPLKIYRDYIGNFVNVLEFVWANDGTELKVDVPLVFKGEDVCPGVMKGGRMIKLESEIPLVCPAELIPQWIDVDVSNLDYGDHIFMRDVVVNTSMQVSSEDEDKLICKIVSTIVHS